MVSKDLTVKVNFEGDDGGSHSNIWWESVPGRGTARAEALRRKCWVCSGSGQESTAAGAGERGQPGERERRWGPSCRACGLPQSEGLGFTLSETRDFWMTLSRGGT